MLVSADMPESFWYQYTNAHWMSFPRLEIATEAATKWGLWPEKQSFKIALTGRDNVSDSHQVNGTRSISRSRWFKWTWLTWLSPNALLATSSRIILLQPQTNIYGPMSDTKAPVKSSRQHNGLACEECRTRKLRCDMREPQCRTCYYLGVTCVVNPARRPRGPRKGHAKTLKSRIGARIPWSHIL